MFQLTTEEVGALSDFLNRSSDLPVSILALAEKLKTTIAPVEVVPEPEVAPVIAPEAPAEEPII